jgi:large subunit ribosomal protein L29
MAVNIERLRGMSPEDLDREEQELRQEIWKLRLQVTTGQLQNPHKVRGARKNLARLLTVRREQELQNEKGSRK